MANQVFDTTIVRPLERPSAADLNQMQGQIYRTMRALDRFRYGGDFTSVYSGFMNYSFFVQANSLMQLRIRPGLGYIEDPTSNTNIDGIPGLNDINSYKPVFLRSDKQFTVPSVPTSGKCRRDLLEVRWFRDNVDPVDLKIYDPTTKQFSTTNLDKTMTTDLSGKNVDFFENGITPSASAYFIYKKGPEVDYVDEDSFSNSTLPSVDADCLALASINVKHGDLNIPNTRIADLRNLLGNDRQFTISGTLFMGTNEIDGTQILDATISAPAGMRCCISRLNQYEKDNNPATLFNQQYKFSIIGAKIQHLSPSFVFYGDLTNQAVPSYVRYPYPLSITINELRANVADYFATRIDTNTADMLRDGAYTSPSIPAAVTQSYSWFTFSLNKTEFYLIAGGPNGEVYNKTDAVNLSGDVPPNNKKTATVSFVIVGQYAV